MTKPEHRHLRVSDPDTGEVFEDGCPACAAREDIINGLERKIRGLIMENANLRRDKEAEAKRSGLWPVGVRLFALWKKAASSKGSKFKYDRFALVEPFLRSYDREKHFVSAQTGPPQNPLEECVAAIIGRVFDHYGKDGSVTRENGTRKHFFEFERIFASSKEFDESVARRPRDWRERALAIDPDLLPPKPEPASEPPPATPEQIAMLRPVDSPQPENL